MPGRSPVPTNSSVPWIETVCGLAEQRLAGVHTTLEMRTGGVLDAARCGALAGAPADTGVPPGEFAARALAAATEQHIATAKIVRTIARDRVRL